MNKYELAKEIELQEERLQQLKKEYIEKSKPNVKVGQCFRICIRLGICSFY